MPRWMVTLAACCGWALLSALLPAGCRQSETQGPRAASPPAAAPSAPCEYEAVTASADGIGKVWMGREIAQVMGHPAIPWLERSTREGEERTDLLVESLHLRPNDVVADIGAGSGYFTVLMARRVPDGGVYAVDIQQEMLDFLDARARNEQLTNIVTVLGAEDDARLTESSCDLVLLVDAYHEFSFPCEMMRSIARALKPGGRVALVEYRAEDPEVYIKPHHKMTESQARREMEAVGLSWIETVETLPQQHLMFFTRAAR